MRTPAGKECAYFFGDYYRGRNHEECRLLLTNVPPMQWKPDLCATCPVPDIQLANECPNLVLTPRLERPFLVLKPKVAVDVSCTKTLRKGFEPHIGCGECHPLPSAFAEDIR